MKKFIFDHIIGFFCLVLSFVCLFHLFDTRSQVSGNEPLTYKILFQILFVFQINILLLFFLFPSFFYYHLLQTDQIQLVTHNANKCQVLSYTGRNCYYHAKLVNIFCLCAIFFCFVLGTKSRAPVK